MKRSVFLMAIMVCIAFFVRADYYSAYIDKYAPMAIKQMEEYGIPASITLAQGLLESAAGRSSLATEGNNHFGIKCHSDWQGETMLRDDDAPDECFRVYKNASESFRDHSLFLRRKRYASLFELDVLDYAGWARGLRKCGYATDPNYADRLITIIERYALYTYDSNKGGKAHDIAEYIISTLAGTHPVRKTRGLHYVIAAPGDTYGKIAKEFNLKKSDILRYNDVKSDGEIKAWQEVYLQEKREEAPEGVSLVTIGADESLHSVAQRFGVKMDLIRRLNPNVKDEPGTRLHLR